MRLDKYLADMSIGTRSQVKEIIKKARVTINDEVVKKADYQVKETDRLQALKNELEKVGAQVYITNDSLFLYERKVALPLPKPITIATYQDHRMALCFAPLVLKTPLIIQEAEVVSKSYPNFWNDLLIIGVNKVKI